MANTALLDPLTPREYEVLQLIAEGLSNQAIADRLVVAHSTVKWYVRQIYDKMGVDTRSQAIDYARESGLIAAATSRHNLPSQPTPFIGRQPDLDALAALLAQPDTRLITIVGPGGMGKTRLALETARQHLNHQAGAVAFVPLQALSDPAQIITTVADCSGCHFQADSRSPRQQLLDYLSAKNMLLVMDNFEHLLEGVSIVSDILQHAPTVRILATSRESLGVYGETLYNLSGMHDPDDAVLLFAHCAQRVDSTFALSQENAAQVSQICDWLEAMPLGIELAAAWLRSLTLDEIAHELQQGLALAENKSYRLRAVFDRSWALLSDKQRQAFRRMSLFRGGCSRTAAEAVTRANLQTLTALVDKSLLRRSAGGRFELHELLRQYAEEQLAAAGEAEATRDAHMNYFAARLGDYEADLRGHRELEILNDIEHDFENLRAAWTWAVTSGDYTAIDQMLMSLYVFADMRSHMQDVQHLFDLALDRFTAESGTARRVCGRLLARQAFLMVHTGPLSSAENLARQALAIAQEFGHKLEIATCLAVLGRSMTEAEPGLAYARESLALYEEIDCKWGRAAEHHIMGYWLGNSGDIEACYQQTLASLALYREIGSKLGIALCLNNIAATLHIRGEWEEAEVLSRESLALHRELDTPIRLVWMLNTLTVFALYRGDFAEAERFNHEALVLGRELGFPPVLADALISASLLAELAGDDAEAHHLAQEAFACIDIERITYPGTVLDVYNGLAWTLCTQGQYDRACDHLLPLLEDPAYIPTDLHRMTVLPTIARILAFRGHALRAAELLSLSIMHRVSLRGWAEANPHLLKLRADLEAQLGPEAYAAAWERGQHLDLQHTIDELRAEFL